MLAGNQNVAGAKLAGPLQLVLQTFDNPSVDSRSSVRSSSRIVNSSPASRAMVSVVRKQDFRRRETWINN